MASPLVGIAIGSRAEFTAIRKGLELLRVMGVPYELELISAQRSTDRAIEWARGARSRGMDVILVSAGGSSALPGLIAANTPLPVIGIPIDCTPLRGQDALYSIIQAPVGGGAPLAAVGINASENAALLATRILAIKYPRFEAVLLHQGQNALVRAESSAQELRAEFPDLADPRQTAPEDYRNGLADTETDPGPADQLARAREGAQDTPRSRGRKGAIRISGRAPAGRDSRGAREARESVEPHVPAPPAKGTLPRTPLSPHPATADEITSPGSKAASASGASGEAAAGTGAADGGASQAIAPAAIPPELAPTLPPAAFAAPAPGGEIPDRAAEASLQRPREPEKPPTPRGVPAAAPRPPARATLSDRLFHVDPESPDVDVVEHAMLTLLEGGLVAIPTDTVYGIAVDATNAEAVERLRHFEGREGRQAMAVLVHNRQSLSRLVTRFPEKIEELTDEFWPGPLTIIFPKPVGALAGVSAAPAIGVRIPDHNTALALISMVARPLATISAKSGDRPPAATVEEVLEMFGHELDCIIDAGPAHGQAASTVLSVVRSPYEILREGAISRERLRKVLGDLLAE